MFRALTRRMPHREPVDEAAGPAARSDRAMQWHVGGAGQDGPVTSSRVYEFDAPLWRWGRRADALWTFATLPQDLSDEVLELGEPYARGFGSLRVEATVGGTTWRTSVFPDSDRGAYILPIKRAVRDAEGLSVGTPARVRLRLVDVEPPVRRR